MNKQIEEMAKIICPDYGDCENCILSKPGGEYICLVCSDCARLYNAGYRNRAEGEWEVFSDEHEICASEFVCSNCGESFVSSELTDEQFIEMMKFCPHCGAKMK